MVSRRKLPNLALNNIFSFPIGLQYTLSFKWPDSDPKCRITIISKGQSLTLISLGEGGPGGGVEGRNGPLVSYLMSKNPQAGYG